MERWTADQWSIETSTEDVERKVEKGSEESKDRGVWNKRATKKIV